jgi:hypothetical protein
MIFHPPAAAARPVPFPEGASTLKRLKWLQREVEHTAAIAEYKGELSLKLKALHELARLLWLEERLHQGAHPRREIDVTEATLERGTPSSLSPEVEERLEEAFRRSTVGYRRENDGDEDDAVSTQARRV